MGHFESYDTSDATTGNLAIKGSAAMEPIIIETGVAAVLVGLVKSDQAGTLYVDQSFDYNTATATGDWDYSATYTVTAGAGSKIQEDIIAPLVRIRFVNGSTDQTYLRLFVRAYGTRGN